jgi:UDP-N-acetylmuramoyl-L-alanyl-D-glutamate--2,6-diaminopimelate ligase
MRLFQEEIFGPVAPIVMFETEAQAIDLAVRSAGAGDLVLVAGKGHETYQTFADRTIHFDDREVLRECIARLPRDGGEAGGR